MVEPGHDNDCNEEPNHSSNCVSLADLSTSLDLNFIATLADGFLEDLGAIKASNTTIRLADEDQFISPKEHFCRKADGCIHLRESFHETVSHSRVLLSDIVLHEIYHSVKHGFDSYSAAIRLIEAFSESDIVRADLEADKTVYLKLERELKVDFERYCKEVMLVYPDLFGPMNKTFTDFSRFCSKLINLGGELKGIEPNDALLVLAVNESGWEKDSENYLISAQYNASGALRFVKVRVPRNTVEQVKAVFWRNGPEESTDESASLVTDTPLEETQGLIKALLDFTFSAKIYDGVNDERNKNSN